MYRGRMPVFYYLSKEEVRDVYLYLRLYPPESTVTDPVTPTTDQKQASSKIVPIAFRLEPTRIVLATNGRDFTTILFSVVAAVLLAGGLWFTLWEIRRLTALSTRRRTLVLVEASATQYANQPELRRGQSQEYSSGDIGPGVVNPDDQKTFHHDDYRTFETSWLMRLLEGEDKAA
jgi:hypothetical protein